MTEFALSGMSSHDASGRVTLMAAMAMLLLYVRDSNGDLPTRGYPYTGVEMSDNEAYIQCKDARYTPTKRPTYHPSNEMTQPKSTCMHTMKERYVIFLPTQVYLTCQPPQCFCLI